VCGTLSALLGGMKTSLAMLFAGLIAAGAWIILEPGMRPAQQPPTTPTSMPAAPQAGLPHSP